MRLLLAGTIALCLVAGVAAADPVVHVSIPTVGIDDAERACHADAIRRAMIEGVHGIDVKTVDVTVAKLSIVIGDDHVLVTAELKVVISTADDQIKSFGSGTATFSIARRQYRPERALALRHQVLGDALEGLQRRMRAAYRRVA